MIHLIWLLIICVFNACGEKGIEKDVSWLKDIVLFDIYGVDVADDIVDAGVDSEILYQCNPGEGCFLDPCITNQDCLSGWCVDHAGKSVCTKPCIDTCPKGWVCRQVLSGGSDISFVCISEYPNLCRPCNNDADCKSPGFIDSPCIEYENGSFCGGNCKEGKCPEGFACKQVKTTGGIMLEQCVSETGECECSQQSANIKAWTKCKKENVYGICFGKRICEAVGQISECDAVTPKQEVCNSIDDDCDGVTDEDTCDDNNPCTEDICNANGECIYEPVVGLCDDKNKCTIQDHCEDGKCIGGGTIDCSDDNPCTIDTCDPQLGCMHEKHDGACDDGDICTENDMCIDGVCKPGKALFCSDGNQCTIDQCDPQKGCVYTPVNDPCDDGDACTLGDQCIKGVCVPGEKKDCNDNNICTDDMCDPYQGCVYLYNKVPCSDGDPCTVGDVCNEGTCLSGKIWDCNDNNTCTDDFCVPSEQGNVPTCVHKPNSAPCDGGVCINGVCTCIPDCAGKECGQDGCGGMCHKTIPLCEKQLGECKGAMKTLDLCINGKWYPCVASNYLSVSPKYQEGKESLCDLLDNDCDGETDEDIGNVTCGLGACKHTIELCVNGKTQVCDPMEGASLEVCDGIDNDCDGAIDEDLGSQSCGLGICFHVVANCKDGKPTICDPFEGAEEEKPDGLDNDCDGEVDEGFPVPGSVIITEMMINPDCVDDDKGEWFEIYNPTEQEWDLRGWVIKDSKTNVHIIKQDTPLIIKPKQYMVFGRSKTDNGNVNVDYSYGTSMYLANDKDDLIIMFNFTVIDAVDYSKPGFPDPTKNKGRSFSLLTSAMNHIDNDVGSNWVVSDTPIPDGCGDMGTPGKPNQQ